MLAQLLDAAESLDQFALPYEELRTFNASLDGEDSYVPVGDYDLNPEVLQQKFVDILIDVIEQGSQDKELVDQESFATSLRTMMVLQNYMSNDKFMLAKFKPNR